MHKFSAEHRREVCRRLSIEESDLVIRIWHACKKDLEIKIDKRTIKEALRGNSIKRQKTREAVIAGLNHMGADYVTDDWLTREINTHATAPVSIPEQMSDAAVPLDSQQHLVKHFSGVFTLYRRHGDDESAIVREALLITPGDEQNPSVHYVNHKGSVYRGTAYKSFGVIYILLFRFHEIFHFASRSIYLSVEPSGSMTQPVSGVLLRTKKTGGQPMCSDLFLHRSKQSSNNKMVAAVEQAFSERNQISSTEIFGADYPTINIPDDEVPDEMKALIKHLRPVVETYSPEKLKKELLPSH